MLGLVVLSTVLTLISGDGSSSNSQPQHTVSSGPIIYSGQSININGVPYAEPVKYKGPGNLNGYRVGLPNGGSIITGQASYVGTRGDSLLAEALRISNNGIGSLLGFGKTVSTNSGDDDSSNSITVQQKYQEPVKPEPKRAVAPEPRPEVRHIVPVAEPERYWVPQPEVSHIAEPEPVRSSVVSVRPEAYRHIINSYDNTNSHRYVHVPVAEHSYSALPEPVRHVFTGYTPELYSTKVYHPLASVSPIRPVIPVGLFSVPFPRLSGFYGSHFNHFSIHRNTGSY